MGIFRSDEDYTEDNEFHAAKSTAMAYNHGLTLASGDYLILQHNDTKYLFDNVKVKITPSKLIESGV